MLNYEKDPTMGTLAAMHPFFVCGHVSLLARVCRCDPESRVCCNTPSRRGASPARGRSNALGRSGSACVLPALSGQEWALFQNVRVESQV